MAKRAALGRGLGALLGDDMLQDTRVIHQVAGGNPAAVSEIPLSEIVPNPRQPRDTFNGEALEELAASIRTLGIIQPLTLRQTGPHSYQIISGERRYRAAKAAGLVSVPAYIRQADDSGMLEMAIVENIQREDLDPVETALSFQRLIEECNLTQEAMALRVGKKRTTITNYLRILGLPDEMQKALKTGTISMGHAKTLAGVDDPARQHRLFQGVLKEGWSVRQLEKKAQEPEAAPAAPTATSPERPALYETLQERLGRHFDGRVSIRLKEQGGGSINIRFTDESQVEDFLKALNQ